VQEWTGSRSVNWKLLFKYLRGFCEKSDKLKSNIFMTVCIGVLVYEWFILFFNKYRLHINIFIFEVSNFLWIPTWWWEEYFKMQVKYRTGSWYLIVSYNIRGQSIKKPNFFFLICCFTYNLMKLVSFKVLPSTLDTPLPTFFPVLERVLGLVLRDGAKVPCPVLFYRLKSATFQWGFQLW